MTTTIESNLKQEDGIFLSKLRGKLTSIQRREIRGVFKNCELFNKGIKLTENQLKRVLKIVNSSAEVLLMPIQGEFGFHPAYAITQIKGSFPGTEAEREALLYIDNNQLPEGYDFKKLSKTFLSKENIQKAKFTKINIHNWKNENHYQY